MTTTPEIQKLAAPLTRESLSQDEAIASMGRYGYGWADSDIAGASAQRGLSEAVVRDISAKKNEAEGMPGGGVAGEAAEGTAHLGAKADAELGFQPRGHPLRQHQVLRAIHRETSSDVGRLAGGHPQHLRQARHP